MERLDITIHDKTITIGTENKSILISNLKKVNKYISREYGPKTAEVVVNFLQVWNEEELDPIYTESTDVSERTSNALVFGNKREKNRSRKRRRRSREAH